MSRIRGALLCLLLGPGSMWASAQTYALKPLSTAEVKSMQAGLDRSLLPDGASQPKVVLAQAFHVKNAGQTMFTVLPVQFFTAQQGLVPGIDRRTDLCGVYLVDGAAPARFSPLADNDTDGAVQCGGVEGVGLARGTGAHPEVLLLFRVHTVRRSWSDPYAVSWSEADGRYVLEHLSAPAGVKSTESLSIAQLRRWVSGK